MRKWLGRLGAQKAALYTSAALLILIIAVPQTNTCLRESLSVHFGDWAFSDNGPYDMDTWGPVTTRPRASGADGALLDMIWDDKAASDSTYIDKFPTDLRIRSLFISNALEFKGGSLEADATPDEMRRHEAGQSRVRIALTVAAEGEAQEPENAFFPLAEAIAHEYLGDRPSAKLALQRASSLPYYNDHWYESHTYVVSLQRDEVYRRIRTLFAGSGQLSELTRFGRRLARSDDREAVEMRGLLLNCLAKAGAAARTTDELLNVLHAVSQTCVPYDATNRTTLGRSGNDGDFFRELTRFQDRLLRSGFNLAIDLPAFYATEPHTWGIWSDEGVDEWSERIDLVMPLYDNSVIAGMVVLEALIGLGVSLLILRLVTRMTLKLPPIGIPALIAIVAAFPAAISDGGLTAPIAFVGACYLVAFVMSFNEKPAWLSLAIGAFATVSAFGFVAIPSDTSENYLVPAIVYALCLPLYARAWKWPSKKGWLFATIGMTVVGLAAASDTPIPLQERALHLFAAALFVILGVSLWFRCQISEASKKLLRASPFALLLVVVALLASVTWQAVLTYEIDRLIAVEAELTDRWRKNIQEIGPPVAIRTGIGVAK